MAQKSDREGLKKKYVDYLGNLIIDGKIKQDILSLTKTRINYLRPSLQTKESNGVTCTNNGDGTFTINGTASSDAYFAFLSSAKNDYKGMKLVGCPEYGSISSYHILIGYNNESGEYVSESREIGNGIIIQDYYSLVCYIYIVSGTVCNNLVFKPMITDDLSATYNDYVSGFDSLTPDIKMDLLWKNANPTTTFQPQSIPLNLKEYNFVYIVTRRTTDSDSLHGSKLIKIGENGQILTNVSGISYREVYETTNNYINFGQGIFNSAPDNAHGIPIYIYGVR